MEDLLAKDSLNRANPKIYLLLYEAVMKQYEEGNEKLYLKETYDTASLFNLTKRMFSILEALDSLDAMPDDKGRARLNYRDRHAAELHLYRPNLYNGGTYNIHKGDYKTAVSFFETYIDCASRPMFSKYHYWATDKQMVEAAFWVTYCGFKLKDPSITLKYADAAQRDTANLRMTLIYMAEAYKLKGDEENYLSVLQRGITEYPESPYFFSHFIDYYTSENMLDSALALVDSALTLDGDSPLYLFAKSSVLLNLKRYDECIVVSDTLIGINDSLPEPYYNAGTAYLNKALELDKMNQPRVYREQICDLCRKALPYMEKYRQLAPEEKKKWGPALYRIYLSLNQGDLFEEVDSILSDD